MNINYATRKTSIDARRTHSLDCGLAEEHRAAEGDVGEQSLYCRNRGNSESDCCNETRVLESKFKVHSVAPSRSPHRNILSSVMG